MGVTIDLACGHPRPIDGATIDQAEEFLAIMLATNDAAMCPVCHTMQPVTGPVRSIDGQELCTATLGIGVLYHCKRPTGHPGPHGIDGHGGLWTWWRIEWDQTPEDRR